MTTANDACVWVCDASRGTLARTPDGLLPKMMITDLDWSSGGALVAGGLVSGGTSGAREVLVLPGEVSTATDLGTGRLPVWVLE